MRNDPERVLEQLADGAASSPGSPASPAEPPASPTENSSASSMEPPAGGGEPSTPNASADESRTARERLGGVTPDGGTLSGTLPAAPEPMASSRTFASPFEAEQATRKETP